MPSLKRDVEDLYHVPSLKTEGVSPTIPEPQLNGTPDSGGLQEWFLRVLACEASHL
jgi:hypothetical protein